MSCFDYHKVLSSEDEKNFIIDGCKNAKIGCIECKKILIRHMTEFLEPIQAKRAVLEKELTDVDEFLAESQQHACDVAEEMMLKVREALKI